MRILAILGMIVSFATVASAETPAPKELVSPKAAPAATEPLSVTVLPATPIPTKVVYPAGKCYEPEQLLRMTESELIAVYKCGIVNPVPCGYIPGTVIYKPGSKLTVGVSKLMRLTAWQGKYVTCESMINRQFGVPGIKAAKQMGESWIDGGPTEVFEYEGSSIICNSFRDEVRGICPGVHLGCMHQRKKDRIEIATWFALDTRCVKEMCLPLRK